ncbi:hypothetical protein INS49_006826 [Diaporthe citri]|uniref:uncharacterized protein n=1 Tax=Diaporthe citri TaxID=83186 RepID=UPI001C81CD86|nr:uncharacterized protein INS49_006826 [Diaporthe citri]KAG6365217.1 hypothetical protein INS49_006826 [Diaporthe citri]
MANMANRRGMPSLSAAPSSRVGPGTLLPELPPISALFLIDFDVKAGYTIIWKEAVPGLELEGVVEYKSLPSGLHTVPDDLIYFVHEDGYAGLSAFINAPTDEEESRHARMIAVGVLVPLSYGRLGRAWRHAQGLKDMAVKLAADRKQTQMLVEYWEKCGTKDTSGQAPAPITDSPLNSPALSFVKRQSPKADGHARNRSASEGAALLPPGHRLSPFHPAWSLNRLLDTFGPLIFPIQRAALLRKRILISTHAPVHEACNFVYDISILANIPHSVSDILDPSAPTQRLRPLFTIGVHDIPFLLADGAMKRPGPAPEQQPGILGADSGSGWIACTTDSILAMKEDLWDVLITMPPSHAVNAQEKVWPTVESRKGAASKATQRDLRRFRTLKVGLRRLAATSTAIEEDDQGPSNNTEPRRPSTLSNRRSRMSMSSIKTTNFLPDGEDAHVLADASDKIVEPMTWAALAYSGFMWWASAGEQRRSDEAEEQAYDNSLISDLLPAPSMHPPRESPGQRRPSGSFNVTAVQEGGGLGDSVTSLTARRATGTDGLSSFGTADSADDEEERARTELAIITYFHRLTSGILSTLAEVVEATEDFDDTDESRPQTGEGGQGGGERQSDPLLRGDVRGDSEEVSRPQVRVDSDALAAMGLDVWSSADAEFVSQVVDRYFGREARVEGKGVELCGLRVC